MDWTILSTSFTRLIIRHQKQLGINAVQAWYLMSCIEYTTTHTPDIAEFTGISQSTIRDLKHQVKAAGWMDENEGLEPLLVQLSDLEKQPMVAGVVSSDNLFFDNLGAWEQVMVLDGFTCRVCNYKWEPDCVRGFGVKKVVSSDSGDTFHNSRVVLCDHCIEEAKREEPKKRLAMYLKGREDRLKDRENSYLTDLEDKNLKKIRAKKGESTKSVPAVPAENKIGKNIVITKDMPEKADVSEPEKKSPPTPPPFKKLIGEETEDVNKRQDPSNQKQASDSKGWDEQSSPTVMPPIKRSKKSITPDKEGEPCEMDSSEAPLAKPPKDRGKKAEDARERWAKNLEKLETTPHEYWDTKMMRHYFEHERFKVFHYSGSDSKKITMPEKDKHINAIEAVLNYDIEEYIKFIPWVMKNWQSFWFGQDGFPSFRNVIAHLDDLMGEYKSGHIRENLAIKASGVSHVGVLEAPEKIELSQEELDEKEAERQRIKKEMDDRYGLPQQKPK